MSNLLEIDNVTLRFGGVVAVNQVSFNVEEGEVFALVGPSCGIFSQAWCIARARCGDPAIEYKNTSCW